jgi:CheY-like chemotaxis protein
MAGRRSNFDLNGVHVLVVDDDADAREILHGLLRHTGALVASVDSVAAALSVLRRLRPDVVVSDIAMPSRSGYDLVREMRYDLALRRIPVIAVTGYGREHSRKRTRAAGFNAYVEKPVDPVLLCRTIVGVLLPQSASG